MKRLCLPVVIGALLTFACSREGAVSGGAEATRGPIIIISIDTLRADRLPIYGYSGVKTPNIDALAKDGLTFENAYAHVPLTLPSHASLLTGLLPPAHGVRNNLGYRLDAGAQATIPGTLKQNGYPTGAAVSSYVLRGSSGMAAAFDWYDDAMDSSGGASIDQIQRSGDRTVAAARGWIGANASRPFFFLLHLYEPHAPYTPPEPFRTEYAGNEYDGEIAATDEMVGRFIAFLKERKLYDSATIVFLSDHGEGLGDHGESEHGIFLYREALRVPLVIKLPSSREGGTRVTAPVQLIDLFPTINELTGVKPATKLPGESLLDVAAGKFADRRIYGETMYPRIHLGLSDLASLVDGTHHYIDAPRPELFDLKADPSERKSVLAERRRVYASMSSELKQVDRTLKAPSNISAEEAAKLAALGYLSRPAGTGDGLGDPKDHIRDVEDARKAAELTSRGTSDAAIAILEPLLRRSPRFADGWTQLGLAYERSGRAEEAITAYRRTIELAPMLASESAISIGELYLATGQVDQAIDHAKLALTSYPGPAHALLARAYLVRRDLPAAEREARWLMDDSTRRVEGMVAMAQVRVAAKRLDEAASLLGAAEREIENGRGADVPMLRFVQGDLLARRGDFAAAQRLFGEEIRRFPRNREAYVRLAALQILQRDVRAGEATLARMVEALPGEASRAAAAETLERLGHRDRAARWRAGAR